MLNAESRLVLAEADPLVECGLTLSLAAAPDDFEVVVAEALGFADSADADDEPVTDLCGEECDEEVLELPVTLAGDEVRELLDEGVLAELLSADDEPDDLATLEPPETL